MSQAAAPSISIVVRWAPTTASSLAKQLAQNLAEAGIRSTWAVVEPAQAQSLLTESARRNVEVALSVEGFPADFGLIRQRIGDFAAHGHDIRGMEVSGTLPRGSFERQLCQAGVRAVICRPRKGKSSIARPLPFGVWEFTPHIALPVRRRWLSFTSAHRSLQGEHSQSAFAMIDLMRVATNEARALREIDQYLDCVAGLCAAGRMRMATIGDLAAEYSQQATGRPQRSILRAAA